METIERMCVTCHKVDQGHGVWTTLAGQIPGETQSGLCPDCCRNRFPQFYDDLGPPRKPRKRVGTLLSSITKLIKA